MMAMDDETGKPIPERERIRRAIRDVVLTPVGTRLLRRDYGSDLLRLVDSPIGTSLRVSVAEAIMRALRAWVPNIKVTRVEMSGSESQATEGEVSVKVYYNFEGQSVIEEVAFR